jgi:predicted double-glycine peptidase
MSPWLETLGVILLALLGLGLGRFFSRQARPYWFLGYAIPMVFVFMIAAARLDAVLEFVRPFSWVMAGRTEFALIAPVVAMALTTPISRLPKARDRRAVLAFMVVAVVHASIWPFLAPAFNRTFLEHLRTVIDRDGICRQRTDYTCGPAAAVTALRRLGLSGEEGKIAILAHTTSAMGTPPDILAEVLKEQYSKDGLMVQYRHFNNLAELPADAITLAVIKYGLLEDHYVAVLAARDDAIIVGDPSTGRAKYSPAEFRKLWRFSGIVLRRGLLVKAQSNKPTG